MLRYDPDHDPPARGWLAVDEADRIEGVVRYHRRAGVRLPNVRLHAVIHVIVENQLAGAWAPAVDALARLRREGVGRHDAIHAIGALLATLMADVTRAGFGPDPNAPYEAALAALTAERWRPPVASE